MFFLDWRRPLCHQGKVWLHGDAWIIDRVYCILSVVSQHETPAWAVHPLSLLYLCQNISRFLYTLVVTIELKISIWYYFVTAVLLMIVWIKHILYVRHPTYVICMYYLSEARTNLMCLGVSFSFFFLFFFFFCKWKKNQVSERVAQDLN